MVFRNYKLFFLINLRIDVLNIHYQKLITKKRNYKLIISFFDLSQKLKRKKLFRITLIRWKKCTMDFNNSITLRTSQ